jgi:hypothetical protein
MMNPFSAHLNSGGVLNFNCIQSSSAVSKPGNDSITQLTPPFSATSKKVSLKIIDLTSVKASCGRQILHQVFSHKRQQNKSISCDNEDSAQVWCKPAVAVLTIKKTKIKLG